MRFVLRKPSLFYVNFLFAPCKIYLITLFHFCVQINQILLHIDAQIRIILQSTVLSMPWQARIEKLLQAYWRCMRFIFYCNLKVKSEILISTWLERWFSLNISLILIRWELIELEVLDIQWCQLNHDQSTEAFVLYCARIIK